MYLNIIKAIYDKQVINIILNGVKLRNETRMPTLPTPTQHSPGIPSQSNKARRNKRNINKEMVKVSLFADDIILYLKDPNNS
jgi:hypothetical protein